MRRGPRDEPKTTGRFPSCLTHAVQNGIPAVLDGRGMTSAAGVSSRCFWWLLGDSGMSNSDINFAFGCKSELNLFSGVSTGFFSLLSAEISSAVSRLDCALILHRLSRSGLVCSCNLQMTLRTYRTSLFYFRNI